MKLSQTFIEREARFGAANYKPLPVVLTKGEGVWLWDIEGKRYLDMMSAYSAVSFGHNHPRIHAAITEQLSRLSMCSRAYYNDTLGLFLEKLCTLTGFDMALPMNSGAEAVETAIKAVRRWGYEVKGIPANQAEIIVTSQNFHGRTVGIISFSSEAEYKQNFGPFLPGFVCVPFGDAAALEAAITPNTCAVITEAIQGEAGIVMPPAGWLTQVREACTRHNVLLVVDEIQSGLGRTGALLACDHEAVKPDGVILGKALGGGVLPVSALVGTRELISVFSPGSHGSTFGGNPLAARVGLEALTILLDEDLITQSRQLGAYLLEKLESIVPSYVRAVRGKGLWIGLDLDPEVKPARAFVEAMMHAGLLSKETHETVIRLAPPLIITRKEIDWALEQLATLFKS